MTRVARAYSIQHASRSWADGLGQGPSEHRCAAARPICRARLDGVSGIVAVGAFPGCLWIQRSCSPWSVSSTFSCCLKSGCARRTRRKINVRWSSRPTTRRPFCAGAVGSFSCFVYHTIDGAWLSALSNLAIFVTSLIVLKNVDLNII